VYYLWFYVVLKVIENISRWSVSCNNNDLPIRTLCFAYSQFLRLLPHDLCKVASAAFEAWTSEVITVLYKKKGGGGTELTNCVDIVNVR